MQQEMLHFASFSNQPGPERRRYPRQKIKAPMLVEVAPGHRCAILDISEGGMSLRSDSYAHFPPKGRFSFVLPGSNRMVEVVAQLAWVNRQGTVGLKFLELDCPPPALDPAAVSIAGMHEHSFDAKRLPPPTLSAISLVTLREKALALSPRPAVALQLIAGQMMALTRSSGAVIAMEGENSTITCVASAGHAPDFGAILKRDSGLSGECVRSGTIVRCDDAEADERIDTVVARSLGFRSAVIFPLRLDRHTIGVLEVLAAEPHHFGSGDVALLTNLAELVLDLHSSSQKQPANADPKREPKTKRSIERTPPEPAPRLELVKPRSQAPKGHSEPVSRTTVPEARTSPVKRTQEADSTCDVCGHKNGVGARDCEACDVPLPAAVEMEAKRIKRGPAYEIPERDDRWERLASALLRPVVLLIVWIVALMLIRGHWSELRAASYLLQEQHAASSAASSTALSRR